MLEKHKKELRKQGLFLIERFDREAQRPSQIQAEFLQHLLRNNADTAFGREFGFSSIRNETEYRQKVPIQDFEAVRPYVDRVINGDSAVLTADPPCMLSSTSGTTGEPKWIPVTETSLKNGSELMLQWLHRAWQDHPDLLDHLCVGVVGQAIESYAPSGLPVGSASGMIYEQIPDSIRSSYAIPPAVSAIQNYDDRYYIIARLALAHRVSYVSTPNPTTYFRLIETIRQRGETLIQSIHDGELGIVLSGQNEVHGLLSQDLVPDPARAKFLTQILEETGQLRPGDCWPELSLMACWLGGSVGLKAASLSQEFADVPLRDLGYLASEGHFTLPIQDNTPGGVLTIQANYYEFIPEASLGKSDPEVVSCHELKLGRRYGVILTTPAGLYRYDINDIVEVTGFHHRTPILAFVGKGRDMTNITGEKMHVNHLLLVFEKVRPLFNPGNIKQFRAVPHLEDFCYEIFVELREEVDHDWLRDTIIPAIDLALSEVNQEYAEKRSSRRLSPPRLHLMRRDWVESVQRQRVVKGRGDSQFKWQILSSDRHPGDSEAIVCTIEGASQG